MNENTVESIMLALENMARKREPIGPEVWMNAAAKLNALLQSEVEQKNIMEHNLAKQKAAYLADGKSVAYAKSMIEAEEGYLLYRNQVSLIDRVLETIRLAKKNAGLASDLMRSGM